VVPRPVPRPLPALDRGAQAVARGAVPFASQVLDLGAEAVARGVACCKSNVLDRGAQTGASTFRRTYLIVVLRPVLRPLPAATRRCCIKRRALGR
jgi:hypothetical protein